MGDYYFQGFFIGISNLPSRLIKAGIDSTSFAILLTKYEKMTYELEKNIWTEADFEKMGWHDSFVYKIRMNQDADLELDIDYIFQWNEPDIEGLPFTFWVAPCTLVFRGVKNLTFELSLALEQGLEIGDIERTDSEGQFSWTIITQQSDIEFISEGFSQYVRQKPSYQFGQTISYQERDGCSLERTTAQENDNIICEAILSERKRDLELYEMVKKRQLKRIEKNELALSKENGEIELKNYLIKKKEINEWIAHYDYWLKNSRFEDWGSRT